MKTKALPAAAAALLFLAAVPVAVHAGSDSGAKKIYEQACASCHDSGLMGAPKLGDREAWKPRLEKGMDTLEKNAIEGFKAMPPKGGFASLSDQEVEEAVEFMVKKSK